MANWAEVREGSLENMITRVTLADRNVGEGLRGVVLVSINQQRNTAGSTLKLLNR